MPRIPVKLTNHAKLRAREFKLYNATIVEMINAPQTTYMNKGDWIFVSSDEKWAFVVVKADEWAIVKTILRRVESRWEHDPKYTNK